MRFVLRIESLEIDDHILDKIEAKHGISFGEVEEACLSNRRHVRKSKEGLYKVFSQTGGGAAHTGSPGQPRRGQLEGSYRPRNDRQRKATLHRGDEGSVT